MPSTLLLDKVNWDLTLTPGGDIAVATEPYALAQDAASAIRLFQGELWYDNTQGVPYWAQILGKIPPLALLKAKFVAAALTVPNVATAVCYIASIANRDVVGQVQITSATQQTAVAAFGPTPGLAPNLQSSAQPMGLP